MKKFIVTTAQLNEYIEKKKAEKVFYEIMESLHTNVKMLSENVSHEKVNQSVINNYERKKLITPLVYEMLVKNKIVNENHQII